MEEIICNIFQQFNYKRHGESNSFTMFKHKEWADFWIIVSLNNLINFHQEEYHSAIIDKFKADKELEKNMSMVILLECTTIDSEVKHRIIDLENDPYYFKKYIIAYTKEDVEEFQRYVDAKDNVLDKIMSSDMFDGLKRESRDKRVGGVHLLYSLSHKLPFLMTNVKLKENKLPNKYHPHSNNMKELYEWMKNVDIKDIETSLIKLCNG